MANRIALARDPAGTSARVVIVGGGISGLSAAYELLRRRPHWRVTVLEADARAGGLLVSERVDGYLCEHAAGSFLDNVDGGAIDLCRQLGAELVQASPEVKRRWVYRRGALRVVPAGPPGFLTTNLVGWRAKLRMAIEPFVRRRAVDANAEETVAQFATRRLGAEAADAIFGPFVTGIFAGDSRQLSVAAAFPRFLAFEKEHGSLFRGLLAAQKRNPGRAKGPKLWAPRHGVAALPAALAHKLAGHIETKTRVLAAGRGPGEIAIQVRTGSGVGSLTADKLVLALPAYAAAEMAAPHDAELARLLGAIRYASAVVVHAALPARAVGPSTHGFGFLTARAGVDPDDMPRCLGCVIESSVWGERAPAGHVLFRLIYGGVWDPEIIDVPDAALADVVANDLSRAFSARQAPRILRIVRHKNAIPQYQLGHLERVAEIESRALSLGWLMAGNAYRGIAVNDCVRDGVRVAEVCVRDLEDASA